MADLSVDSLCGCMGGFKSLVASKHAHQERIHPVGFGFYQ